MAVDGEVVAANDRPGPVPSSVRVAAVAVPAGDLSVVVSLGSTRDGTSAAGATSLAAAVPLSGRAVRAGPGRYRLDLAVAASWARRACGRSACPGVDLAITSGRHRTTTWTDGDGAVSAVVVAPRGATRLAVRVEPAGRRHRVLRMRRLVLTVGISG